MNKLSSLSFCYSASIHLQRSELTAKKEQESELNTTGALLGLDPSSRQRLIGLATKEKSNNPFNNL